MFRLNRSNFSCAGAALLALFLLFGGGVFSQSAGKKDEPNKAAASEAKGDGAKGRVIYKRNCEICHHATSTAKKIGPGLKGIYKTGKFADGRPVNDGTMRVWIEDGGKDMPQFKNTLKAEQITDLIAYMRTL